MTNLFAEYIIKNRALKGYNQIDLVEKLKTKGVSISQSTLSSYEQNKKFPSIKKMKELIVAFEDIFGAEGIEELIQFDMAVAKKTVHVKSKPEAIFSPLVPEKLLQDADHLLETTSYQYDIWFLGSQKLPVVSYKEFQDSWKFNLEKGVNYNMIVFKNIYNNAELFDALTSAMTTIAKKTRNALGKIHLYLVDISDNESDTLTNSRISSIYNALDADLIKKKHIPRKTLDDALFVLLMESWQTLVTLCIYIPKHGTNLVAESYMRINNVKAKLNDPVNESPVFFWLDKDKNKNFWDTIYKFEKAVALIPFETANPTK